MEPPDKSFSELVDIFKSWIPRRAEPGNLSRDFWMPDHSCRVCYECDSQFTLFNRRHHCRLCGRVFCARCTANSIPTPCIDPKSHQEEWERIRVCNYCFKQWEQDIVTVNNGTILCSPGLSPSKSLASAKSSFTGNSSCVFAPSIPYSTGDHQDVEHGSGLSSQSIQMGVSTENQDTMACGRNEDSVSDTRGASLNEYGFCINRSDDEDDEYGSYRAESDTKCFQSPDDYYDQVKFDLIDNGYRSHKVHRPVERPDRNDLSSSTNEDPNSQVLLTAEKLGEDVEGHDFNGEECDAASSIYGVECTESETVDFENNGLLWLPPEPEDEEDEKEAVLFDDDDDEDATGEWKQLRSSSSFGSGEYRSITVRTTEEHQKVMKAVVEGHFRALVAQLLQVENLHMDEEDKESWLDIITSLSWEAATILKPDTSKGGGMDPGGYVKVKCIACGHRSESAVVKGVVCKKNVAHRHMTSKIKGPRFLILGGALEYQRVSNLLSSFDTLLQQEMDHLKMAVAKIDAHHPNVLLVEKSVSRFAQECLLAKNISLVLNVKRPLLERIARCTGAQIIPSVDLLSSQKLGHCETFHVEKYLEQHGSAGKGGKKLVKTLMFFEGCPKPLGCTILLKGANGDDLKIVKHVIQYGIFAAYHLALETSFLADEGASLPELPLKSPLTVALPDTSSSVDRSISMIPGFTTPTSSKQKTHSDIQQSNDVLKSKQPFSRMEDPMSLDTPKGLNSPIPKTTPVLSKLSSSLICDPKELLTIKDTDVPKYSEERHKDTVGVTDNNSLLHQDNNNLQEKQASEKEEFPPSPSDHQSILVSLSTRCVWKGTVCERAHLFRIKYYGNFDKPLGRFLGDHLFDQCYRCRSCDMPAEAHVHCYTHRQGSLTISVKKLLEFPLPGERDGKVWMWHRCLKCPRSNGFPPATRRIAMSDAAWGLSFGKFLELSFSNHAAASRVASCGHSLHRDCLRFYGFGNMVACFRYASIDVHSVYLPPHKLDFNLHNQEWIQKEANEVAERAKLLFNEVLNALGLIAVKHSGGSHNSGLKISQSSHHIGELEAMLQRERAEFEEFLQRVVKKEPKKGQPLIDILEINRLQRQLLFHSYVWDQRLISATGLGSAQCKELTGRVTNCKEKPTSVEKLAEMNLPSKALSLTSPDTLTVNMKNTNAVKGILSSPDNQGGYKPDHYIGKLNSDLPESLEGDKPVRRALSEGQFPMVANLSETLDAAWTGEAAPTSIRPQENSFALLDSFTLDSSTPLQSPAFIVESERPCANPEDKGQVEVVHTPGSELSVKVPDRVDDFTSWIGMPFLSFYRSFNKNSSSDSAKLNSFSEYNPVYVSSFQELVHQGGARLLLPVGINDTVVSVYDNEPTSIISYALVSLDYHFQMSDERERIKSGDFYSSLPLCDSASIHPFQTFDEITQDSLRSFGSADSLSFMSGSRSSLVDPLLYTNAMPVRVSFTDDSSLGKVKYMVTCYYAKGFEALRRICCPSELDFVRSLCRCKRWGAQGGKSNALFEKSLDDRFIIKQVTKTELESFAKFAPGYFKYLSESIGTGSPTCLAKILGIYQISSKHLKGGKESRIDVLVMENLMFGRKLTKVYDLKGSSRSRYNDCSGTNKVLLDQNLIEAMPTSPIFVGNKAKRLLERAVWNDTSFLASIDVMDYSLLVGVDEEKHELVLGIIDFIRQYTWDKHLETWVKASGILGGPKNSTPTVVSPKQYKKRFRKAMSAYFLMVPDQWFPPTIIPNHSQSDLKEENLQNISP